MFVPSWTRVRQVFLGVLFRNDYGGVYVFHVCFDLCIVYGVGICVDVCVVECCLFLASGCLLCSGVL